MEKIFQCARVLLLLSLVKFPVATAFAQGSAFTYQGRLSGGSAPADGTYDFAFTLYETNKNGVVIAGPVTNSATFVTNGLFTVLVDFGAGVFTGTNNWLAIAVRTNATGSFTTLTPRQPVTPTPYALYSASASAVAAAGVNGTLSLGQIPSAVLTNNAATVSLGTLTLSGTLNLPNPVSFSAAGSPLLSVDNNEDTYFGLDASGGTANNTGIGYEALFLSSGSDNTAVGDVALQLNNGSDNTAIGYGALNGNDGTANSGNGYEALEGNSGSRNTANGYEALLNNTGLANTASGYEALGGSTIFLPQSGSNNVADGSSALYSNTTGSENTAVGVFALGNSNTDNGLVAVGFEALQNDASSGGLFSIGSGNTAIGYQSLKVDTSGSANTGVGYQALWSDSSGANNTALGLWSLFSVASGTGNIGIGYLSGSSVTGDNNIDIGNEGASSDIGVVRIGTPGIQTSTYLSGNVAFDGGLNVDQTGTYGANNGTVTASALTFGTGPAGSGEGIASQRTSGPNQFDLTLFTGFKPRLTVLASGNVGIGMTNPGAMLEVDGNTRVDGNLSTASLTIRGGADLAEPFKISAASHEVQPGAVVVIDEANPGQLKLTDQPYDPHVAGVVSGANGIRPGIQMHQEGMLEGGQNVALSGRVYVQADTSNGLIKPGDLLTTSSTPGRAMKVTDHARAAGAILGKAMTALSERQGLVLVLVTLQ